MTKDTAKKNWRRNVARMRIFAIITLAVNVLYTCVIMYRNGGLPGIRDLVAIAFWACQEYFCYSALNAFGRPVFGEDGQLMDCADASSPKELGYYSFAQDVLWVCWVVQTLCNVHGAFVVFYLPVPATVMYKAWTMFLKPMLAARGSGGEDEGGPQQQGGGPQLSRQERRQQERTQRKAKK